MKEAADEATERSAKKMAEEEFKSSPNISGNVIGVDISKGEIYISRREMVVTEYYNKILEDIKNTDNPVIKAIRLSVHLSNMLKENKVNIYEAYLLQGEIINYRREGYTLPAWNDTVQISTCLAILNQRLLALAFKDDKYAGLLKKFGIEALHLCKEKRAHYIMDDYMEFMYIEDEASDLLYKLYNARKKYNSLSDEEGPFHVEEFPYHYYEPEKILLDKKNLQNTKSVSKNIETLLIELNT